jgi:hypothetical protein
MRGGQRKGGAGSPALFVPPPSSLTPMLFIQFLSLGHFARVRARTFTYSLFGRVTLWTVFVGSSRKP